MIVHQDDNDLDPFLHRRHDLHRRRYRCERCQDELAVACPMCGLGRPAIIDTCTNCGLVLKVKPRAVAIGLFLALARVLRRFAAPPALIFVSAYGLPGGLASTIQATSPLAVMAVASIKQQMAAILCAMGCIGHYVIH